jgi:hypothetical protein
LASSTISNSPGSKTNSQTFIFQSSNSSKFQAFASVIINLTSLPNFGQIALPFGLQIFLGISDSSNTFISFTFNSSFKISL